MNGELANAAINSVYAYILQLIYVGTAAVWDVRQKRIPGWLYAGFGIPVMLVTLVVNKTTLTDSVWSLAGSVPLLLLSVFLPGAIGMADSVILLEIGLGLGVYVLIASLAGATLLCAVFGGTMLITGRIGKKTSIPFVPFILAGLLIGGII